jgi:Transposase, Mutator family
VGPLQAAAPGPLQAAAPKAVTRRPGRKRPSQPSQEEDLLAFFAFPESHRPKLRATNPLVLVNREIGHRSDVVCIFPIEAAAIRLADALLIEQNDEWLLPALPCPPRAWPSWTLCRTTASESERTNRK